MEGMIVGSLAIGVVCIILSFVLKENSDLKEGDKEKFVKEVNERVLGEQNVELILAEVRAKFSSSVDDLTEERILKISDEMNQNANEKMLAIQDMADSLLEKIEQNHKEVVFLYDMLNQKSEEVKDFQAQVEGVKKNLQEEEKKLGMAYEYIQKKMRVLNAKVSEKIQEKGKVEKETSKVKKGHVKEVESQKKKEVAEEKKREETKEEADRNEKILKMNEEGRSVLEISKELGIGQGEVKLILGIYANVR